MVLSASKNNNFIRAGQEASARCNACHSISKEMAMVAPPRPHSSRANDWTMGQRSMSCGMRIMDITATISIMCILTHHRQGRGLIGAKGQRHCDDAIRLDHRDELADLPAVQWQRRHHQPVRLRHRRPKGKSLAGMQSLAAEWRYCKHQCRLQWCTRELWAERVRLLRRAPEVLGESAAPHWLAAAICGNAAMSRLCAVP